MTFFTLCLYELPHLIPAIIICWFAYRQYQSKRLIVLVLAVSFLIDLDHLFDFYHFTGGFNFGQLWSGTDYFTGSQKVFVLAHSWELAILLVLCGWLKHRPVILAVALAFLGHILIDQLTYTPHPFGYFLIFRIINSFSLASFNGV